MRERKEIEEQIADVVANTKAVEAITAVQLSSILEVLLDIREQGIPKDKGFVGCCISSPHSGPCEAQPPLPNSHGERATHGLDCPKCGFNGENAILRSCSRCAHVIGEWYQPKAEASQGVEIAKCVVCGIMDVQLANTNTKAYGNPPIWKCGRWLHVENYGAER